MSITALKLIEKEKTSLVEGISDGEPFKYTFENVIMKGNWIADMYWKKVPKTINYEDYVINFTKILLSKQ